MEIENVRNAFAKGCVYTSSNSISIFYISKQWFSDVISDDGKDVFLNLLENADRFGVSYSAGEFVQLSFFSKNNNYETKFYKPIKLPQKEEDIEFFLNQYNEEFMDRFETFMLGTDTANDDEVTERIVEWIDLINKENNEKERCNLSNRWHKLKERSLSFCDKLNFEYDIMEADNQNEGSIEVWFPENIYGMHWFKSSDVADLWELSNLSDAIGLEGNPKDHIFNITFFA